VPDFLPPVVYSPADKYPIFNNLALGRDSNVVGDAKTRTSLTLECDNPHKIGRQFNERSRNCGEAMMPQSLTPWCSRLEGFYNFCGISGLNVIKMNFSGLNPCKKCSIRAESSGCGPRPLCSHITTHCDLSRKLFWPRPRDSWVICDSALGLIEEAVEFAAGRIEGALLLFRPVVDQWAAVGPKYCAEGGRSREALMPSEYGCRPYLHQNHRFRCRPKCR